MKFVDFLENTQLYENDYSKEYKEYQDISNTIISQFVALSLYIRKNKLDSKWLDKLADARKSYIKFDSKFSDFVEKEYR